MIQHILSIDQFTKPEVVELCERAIAHSKCRFGNPYAAGQGRILANLFYEPSTRTSSSFYAAMVRLGGQVIPINNVQYSSVAKGETLEDTIRTLQCYADAIVLRHSSVGAAARAAEVATVPIINAGDGVGEHPTQALLDFHTIRQERRGEVDGLHVVMLGDLANGRTVKSLTKLLRKYDVKISWISPEQLRIPPEFVRNGEVETADLDAVIESADVLYVTRVQRERLSEPASFNYGVSLLQMQRAKPDMVLMHPLPRTSELPTSLDTDPRSAYFRQMRHGLFMRMAILEKVLLSGD